MSSLEAAIELGTYNQGELGVYGRPDKEYNVDTDNPYKKFINEGRHIQNYFERLETVENLIVLMHTTDATGLIDSDRTYMNSLPDRKLEFLEDTLRFLITGKRKLPLEHWMLVIDDGRSYMNAVERRETLASIAILRSDIKRSYHTGNQYTTLSTYISMWCDKADGVRDMAYSLYFYSLIPQLTN